MKRIDLVQLTIIIVGIFSGFFFVLSIPQVLFYLYDWFSDGMSGRYISAFLSVAVIDASYLLTCFYCIAKSRHFAQWISQKANLESDINFSLNKTELLFVLFIGLGIYGLITHVPSFLVAIYDVIRSRNKGITVDTPGASDNVNLAVKAITILAFFVLTYYANVFADFFAAKINNVQPEKDIADKLID